jgi:hypothetical protein
MKDTDAKALFEQATQRLDPASANRLRLARRAALAGDGGQARRATWRPALAAAAVLALGLAWWLPRHRTQTETAPPAVAADEALPPEVEEDSELYAWLAEAPVASDGQVKEQSL